MFFNEFEKLKNLKIFLTIIDEILRKRQFCLTSFDVNRRQSSMMSLDVIYRQFTSINIKIHIMTCSMLKKQVLTNLIILNVLNNY